MNEYKSAFPVVGDRCGCGGEVLGIECRDNGLTAKQYAAIHLRVPRSGDPDIDAMIRENRRAAFAEQVLADGNVLYTDVVVKRAFEFAGAMLAEWEK